MDMGTDPVHLRRVAFHEAGHTLAIMGFAPQWFHRVTIEPDGIKDGRTDYESGATPEGIQRLSSQLTPRQMELFARMHVCIAIAGGLGQAFAGYDFDDESVSEDILLAMEVTLQTRKARGIMLEEKFIEPDWNRMLDVCQDFMMALLKRERDFLYALADTLLGRQTLSRDDVLILYKTHWRGRSPAPSP